MGPITIRYINCSTPEELFQKIHNLMELLNSPISAAYTEVEKTYPCGNKIGVMVSNNRNDILDAISTLSVPEDSDMDVSDTVSPKAASTSRASVMKTKVTMPCLVTDDPMAAPEESRKRKADEIVEEAKRPKIDA